MNRKRGSFYTKIAPNLLGEITLEKPLLQAYKNAGGVLFGEYVVLESLARCTREKESMHYTLGKKLLPTPIASDAVCATAIYHFNTDSYSQKPSKATLSIYRRFCERERVGDYGLDCRDIRGDDGFSTRLEQIHALGNAVLPCIVSAWGEIIKELYPFFSGGSCSTMPSKKG